jgi:uncharacterized membrane protein
MNALLAACLIWLGLHLGVAGSSLRGALVARLGERGYRGLFVLASLALLAFLIHAFNHAPRSVLWVAPLWLRWILALLMVPACVWLVAALTTLSLRPEEAGTRRAEVRGILRVTRHPMLWSFALWAIVHILGNGELAATLFFGTFLVTALAGMPSIDRKAAARAPEMWKKFAAQTSILPYGAILAGRNRLVLGEFAWALPLGLLLWLGLLWTHQRVFGVAPVALPWTP